MARTAAAPPAQSPPGASRTITGATPGATPAVTEPRLRQRRPIHWFYLGVLLLALGGIAGGWYLGRGGATRTVVVVASKITAGQKITADQLGTAQLPMTSDVASIPDSRLCDPKTKPACSDGLVGMYAQATLTHGALLTTDDVVSTLTPTAGHSVIGVAFKPSQMPAQGLAHGDTVRLVLTVSASGAAAPSSQQQPGTAWPGKVVSSGPAGTNGVITVDVQVASDVATAVAAAAGGGNIAAVLDPPASS